MGGEERVARQHARGRLTVRERIERLFDAGTFHETGALAGVGAYDEDGELTDFTPANMVVRPGRDRGPRRGRPGRRLHRPRRRRRRGDLAEDGLRRAARARPAAAARAARRRHGRRRLASSRSSRWATPTCPSSPAWSSRSPTSRACPVAAAALGPVAGLGAARVVASHFSVIVRGTSQLFVAGPPVVAAAMGESPDKEALGGSRMQTRAGAVDNEAADEDDALAQLRRFLSYLPPSVWEPPPVVAGSRPARPPRGGAALDRPARPAQALRHARDPRARSATAARCSSSARATAAR